MGDWKLSLAFYFNASSTDGELFNLASDEAEAHDVSRSNPHIVTRLRARMDELAREAVPPYQPWAPWQGAAYGCCDCNESWAVSVAPGAARAWLPWIADGPLPSAGTPCLPPFARCEIPPCYSH
jgi:hypothetical protein